MSKLYKIHYIFDKGGKQETKWTYYVQLPSDEVRDAFIIDEERRANRHVYLEECIEGEYNLDFLTYARVQTSSGASFDVPIYTESEVPVYTELEVA